MESERERQEEFKDTNHVSAVVSVLNHQRVSSKLCDVVLRISGDELYAHSNVLAAASPYFDNLFSGPDLPRSFSQKSPQIIEIHIDGDNDNGYGIAVQRVVDFMYTARITIEDYILPQIMEIANIMQMATIIGFCETFRIKKEEQPNTLEKVDGDISDKVNTKEHVTDNKSSENETFEVIKDDPDVTEALTFKKNLKDKPMVLYVHEPEKRKRGRPRKETRDLSVSNAINEQHVNEKENSNTLDDQIGANAPEKAAVVTYKTPIKKNVQKPVKLIQKVSRSGRVIKPRLFSDGTIIKQKPVSEFEIKKEVMDEFEPDKNMILEKLANDEDACIDDDDDDDDDISDPSFPMPKACKLEDNMSYTVKNYACEKCDVVVSRLKDFHEHNREHMHAEKKCSYCGWVCENSDNEAEFEKHLNNHIGPKPFFCNFCNVRFKTRAQLFLHLPKHSKAKPFVCNICNTGFKWKHALKNHLIIHQETKDYLCDICGFSTAYKMQLKSHRLIHTGETYKCPEVGCTYQATKKTNMNFHILTHTREKPHQCDICGTAFSLVKNMKRHMLLHKSDRPFKCDRCLFTSTRFDKLKEHYFKQHNIGEKPGKKFTWAEYLQQEENGFQTLDQSGNEEENVLDMENMETIELEIASEESVNTTTQMLNLTSSTGENIPITITQIGSDISYEIPVHLIVPEAVTDQ